jgi:predicted ester cyclase
MPSDPNPIVRAFVDAVNGADAARVTGIFAPAFVDRTPAPGQSPGPEGFVQEKLVALRSAFPDFQLSIEDELVEGDRVAWRRTLRGTNEDRFAGHPPTGRRVEFGGINIEWLADGKIVEHWSVHDSRNLFEQLGLFSPRE